MECVVVDNGSTDGTAEAVRREFPRVRVIRNRRSPGYGAGCNQGVRAARSPHVLLLEADTRRLGKRAVDILRRHLESNPRTAMAVPRLVLERTGRTQMSAFRSFPGLLNGFMEWSRFNWAMRKLVPRLDYPGKYYLNEAQLGRTRPVAWAMTAVAMVRRSVFLRVGGFDERIFLLAEDTDLCRRLRDRGWSIDYVPSAGFGHVWGVNQSSLPSTIRHYAKGLGHYLEKSHGRLYRWAYMACALAGALLAVPQVAVLWLCFPSRRPESGSALAFCLAWIRYCLTGGPWLVRMRLRSGWFGGEERR
jgi:hypothetical protein